MDDYSKLRSRIKELEKSGKLDKTSLKKELEKIELLQKNKIRNLMIKKSQIN